MAIKARVRYHWTHKERLASIASSGLDPGWATGIMRVVWMCERRLIEWASLHIATRHDCDEEDLVLLRIDVSGLPLNQTRWGGINTTPEFIPAERLAVYSPDGNHKPLVEPPATTPVG